MDALENAINAMRIPCIRCGESFTYRTEHTKPQTPIERLCDACFAQWTTAWTHRSAKEAILDESHASGGAYRYHLDAFA